jgi:hypothetical protein
MIWSDHEMRRLGSSTGTISVRAVFDEYLGGEPATSNAGRRQFNFKADIEFYATMTDVPQPRRKAGAG